MIILLIVFFLIFDLLIKYTAKRNTNSIYRTILFLVGGKNAVSAKAALVHVSVEIASLNLAYLATFLIWIVLIVHYKHSYVVCVQNTMLIWVVDQTELRSLVWASGGIPITGVSLTSSSYVDSATAPQMAVYGTHVPWLYSATEWMASVVDSNQYLLVSAN